ncbi:MAG: hypothetical protein WBX30_26845 [Stellaceae bacterium]
MRRLRFSTVALTTALFGIDISELSGVRIQVLRKLTSSTVTFAAGDLHVMADAKRLLDHHQHRTEEVGETVPGRERNRQTANPQPGKHRIGRETQLIGPLGSTIRWQWHTGKADAKANELAV